MIKHLLINSQYFSFLFFHQVAVTAHFQVVQCLFKNVCVAKRAVEMIFAQCILPV
jgi:hypothetical protein